MISYCTTVYNEIEYIKILLDKLFKIKLPDEEIVVLQTYKNPEEQNSDLFIEIQNIIKSYDSVVYSTYHFQNNFSDLKNVMNSLASKQYIFNLDADEDYPETGFDVLRKIIAQHSNIDLFYLPRINIVEDLTLDDIKEYSWNINDKGWVNWPDYQPRLYKNLPHIKWGGDVHEGIIGTNNKIPIEAIPDVAIIHNKHIKRQREQNAFYDSISKQNKDPISISSCRTLIGLCSWDNPHILKQCVDSLLSSIDTSIDKIAVVLNEGDKESIEYLRNKKIAFVFNPENSGPLAIDFLKPYIERSQYFVNANDDMIFHPGFVEDLISIIETNYPATASCGLVENFNSGNPSVFHDPNLLDFTDEYIKLFNRRVADNIYKKNNLTYGYNHPIMCRSLDMLMVGGYSGNWDMNFLSGYGRDDVFPFLLWKLSQEKYRFIVSKDSVVFHLSSYTNNKLPVSYRNNNHNQDKFFQLTGMPLQNFRQSIIKIGQNIEIKD